MEKEFYTRAEVADMLGLSVGYLLQKDSTKLLPFEKDQKTKRVRYSKEVIKKYIENKLENLKNKIPIMEVFHE